MKETALKFPVIRKRLPPPPAGSLDEYYEFLTLTAASRPSTVLHLDEAADIPRFRLETADPHTTRRRVAESRVRYASRNKKP